MLYGVKRSKKQTEAFAATYNEFKGPKSFYDLWHFVKYNIDYQEDEDGYQWIQSPSALYKKRVGDCKSFTVFISSVLQNWGIEHVIRFVSYSKYDKDVTHVYVVARYKGKQYIIDSTIDHYNQEITPYYHKKDYKIMPEVAYISGVHTPQRTQQTFRKGPGASRAIKMVGRTEGELYLQLMHRRLEISNFFNPQNYAANKKAMDLIDKAIVGYDRFIMPYISDDMKKIAAHIDYAIKSPFPAMTKRQFRGIGNTEAVSYTHLRAHET